MRHPRPAAPAARRQQPDESAARTREPHLPQTTAARRQRVRDRPRAGASRLTAARLASEQTGHIDSTVGGV